MPGNASQPHVPGVSKRQQLAAGVWLLLVPGLKGPMICDSWLNAGKAWKNNLVSRRTGLAI